MAVPATRLEVRMLGPFEVLVGGQPVAMTSDRVRSMLAVLAMAVPDNLPAEVLGRRIWGAESPAHVRRSVHTLVARLRRQVGVGAVGSVSIGGTGGYRLIAAADQVDVLRFRRLLAASAVAAGEQAERQLLDEALGLWRGAPFSGLRSEWLAESEAPRLQEQYLAALERRIDLDIAAGRYRSLVPELHELTARHPLRESLWARLLDVLDRSGRPAEALSAYDLIRGRLNRELGVDPGMELQRIYTRLLAADAPPGPALPVPRQLPADIAHFAGRTEALAALDRLLPAETDGSPGRPIVIASIDGAGGIGKTAVAVHWAHRVRHRFGDGQLYLNLRGYGPGDPIEPAAALDSLLRSMGVPGAQIPAGLEARAALFRSRLASRRMLLVLDNARSAEQVRPLLPGSSTLVLITSRSQLRGLAAGERAHRIVLDQLMPADAVTLLASALEPAGYDEDMLAELAELCGYLPLALAIAAERARREPATGLTDLVAQIRTERHRLDAFDSGDDPTTSVRAVFSWSYQALDPDGARLFRLLGLQPGPEIDTAAAAALAGTGLRRTGELLRRLVDGHLLLERRPGRFELHDLLRTYAVELAEAEPAAEREAALDRLFDFYIHTANAGRAAIDPGRGRFEIGEPRAGVLPLPFADERQALAWFDDEQDTLAAVVLLAADQERHRTAAVLTHVLWALLYARHGFAGWASLQRVAVYSARQTGDLALEVAVTNHLAVTQMRLNAHDQAVRYFERSLELCRQSGDRWGHARTLASLGLALRRLGWLQQSRQCLESAVAGYQRAQATTSGPLNNLALTYLAMRRHDDAIAAARRSIDLDVAAGARLQQGHGLDTLGQAYAGKGKYTDAITAYEQSLALFAEFGDRWNQAATLVNLGKAQCAAGERGQAVASWHAALGLLNQLGAEDSSELRRSDIEALIC